MTHEPSRTTTGHLTDLQRACIEYARRDYEQLRTEDLARLSDAALILLLERLRIRLYDMLQLIDEITGQGDQA
jgi:hypothetical protein